MAFKDFINSVRKSIGFAKKIQPMSDYKPTPDFGGSRVSLPKPVMLGGGNGTLMSKKTKQDLNLDDRLLSTKQVTDLVDILADAHPDFSFAIWNFIRIANSGYTIEVTKLGTGKRWSQAEKDMKELADRLDLPSTTSFEKGRSLDKIAEQLLLSVIMRGACALELIPTPKFDDVSFLAPVEPSTIDFKIENGRFVPYQNYGQISLDLPTFFYDGLDEIVDNPYGRSPVLSAINIIIFQMQVLNDIKAVVHNQGYPRIDIQIIEEVLLQRMPIAIRNNEQKKQEWLKAKLDEIIAMYSTLEPDDAYVHFDSVVIGSSGGGKDGGALIDPEKLMTAIDNLIMSGLKTLSTILGRRSSGNTESFAKLEIKLYLQGVIAIQRCVERAMGKALTLGLNIKGKQGIVKFKFNDVEIRTELEQEQFKQTKYTNLAFARDQGWIDQNEASQLAVGHASVAEPNYEALGKIATDPAQGGRPSNGSTPANTGTTTPNNDTPGAVVDTNPSAGGNTDTTGGN
jgi:hypothetical protein